MSPTDTARIDWMAAHCMRYSEGQILIIMAKIPDGADGTPAVFRAAIDAEMEETR